MEGSIQQYDRFEFDKVLGPDSSQSDIFKHAVQPLVDDVMMGYNGTVMAYGQTGAGKTYTLGSMDTNAIGMFPRAVAAIFARKATEVGTEYSVKMSYIQIYMETIQDLLQPESSNLQIREDSRSGVYLEGVSEHPVVSAQQCLQLLHLGDRNRVFAITEMNAHSSRSHAIVMLSVVSRSRIQPEGGETVKQEDGTELVAQRVRTGKLFIVDLAGSERVKKSRSTGLRFEEAKKINLSLTALGLCINARADPRCPHVPFRDSKLTRLLQDALGGNSKTSLVVCVSDVRQHTDESMQSCAFGSRAMEVKLQPKINESLDYREIHEAILHQLQASENDITARLQETVLEKERIIRRQQEEDAAVKAEAAEAKRELQRERAGREEAASQLAEAQERLQGQEQRLAAAAKDVAAAVATISQLQDELGHADERVEALQASIKQREQQAEASQRQAEARTQELQQQHAAALAEQQAAMAAQAESAAAQQRREADAAAEAQQARAQAALNSMTARAERASDDNARLQAEVDRLAAEVDRLGAEVARLATALRSEQAALADERGTRAAADAQVAELAAQLQQLQSNATRVDQLRLDLFKGRREVERRSRAAMSIQRAFRRFRIRHLASGVAEKAHELRDARHTVSSLQEEKQGLQNAHSRAQAVFGRTTMQRSMEQLKDAVTALVDTFLLPSRTAKTLGELRSKSGLSPPPAAAPPPAPGNLRAPPRRASP